MQTLLELAPPGRARPTVRAVANLVRHGLRCRLGRPATDEGPAVAAFEG